MGDEGEGKRRICQACFKRPAEHHCQACRRYICDDCLAPAREVSSSGEDFLEDFLQASLVKCRACEEDHVRLPPHDVHVEGA